MSNNAYGTYDKGSSSNRSRDDLKSYSSGRRDRDREPASRDPSHRDPPHRDPPHRDPPNREPSSRTPISTTNERDSTNVRDSSYGLGRDTYKPSQGSSYGQYEPRNNSSRPRDPRAREPERNYNPRARDDQRRPQRNDYSAYDRAPATNDSRQYGQYQDRARERVADGRDKSPSRPNGRNFDRDYRERPQYKPRYDQRDPQNQRNHRNYRDQSDRNDYRDSYKQDTYPRETYSSNTSYSNDSRDSSKQVSKPESNEDQIKRLEKRLATLVDVPPIELIKVLDSRWGVKPNGFEDVTAQRAKLSGLFPLPGHPRPVDMTKLEGAIKDRLANSSDILNETSKIDAIDSRNSKILLIKNINFEHINYLKVVEYFNDFLKAIDIDETGTNNIESKRKTKNETSLIIQFTNSVCATIVSALNGTKVSFNELKEDSEAGNDDEIELVVERPNEYVVQSLAPYKEAKDVDEKVVDSPRKITLSLPDDKTETQIIDELKAVAPLRAFQLLREIGTKKSLGIAFVEFYVDPSYDTSRGLLQIQKYLEQTKTILFVSNAFLSCKTQSIQDCVVDFRSLKSLVRNENVTAHPKLRVIQLLNIVTAKDLMDDVNFQYTQKDIHQEVSKLGKIQSIKIPRPANDYTPGLVQFSQPGLGKIFIEFEDEDTALKAIMELAGRLYNDRTVLCAFHDFEDYKNGLF